jgi:KDO2-lipid IV(A) lauroyltransferase
MRKHILDRPIFYYAIFVVAGVLPVKVCRLIAKFVVAFVYPFLKKDRIGLANNLALALMRSPADPFIQQKVKRIFYNYGQYMADFFIMPQLPPSKKQRYFDHVHGENHIHTALAKGRGVILLSAHLGNWEFGGTMMRLYDYSLAVVALPHNTSATNALVNRLRKNSGIKIIELTGSPFTGIEILQHLRRNGVVAMVGDKDFFGTGRPTPFFGQPVDFPVGPIALAMKSGAALIPAFVLQGQDGRYFGLTEKAIPLESTGNRDKDLAINLTRIAQVFEKYIRRYPDQWYCPDPINAAATRGKHA